MTPQIRAFRPEDSATLSTVYFKAVRDGAKAHYTARQRRAWAPDAKAPPDWAGKLAVLDTLVAEVDGEIAGFMACTYDGYIDLAFVHPQWMRRGVAQALYEETHFRARTRALPRLTAHASHLARAFFARNGWQIDGTERVERNGERLQRFTMSCQILPPD